MTTPGSITVGTSWTRLIDLTGIYTRRMTISRESLQTLELVYVLDGSTPPESAQAEFRVTASFLAIDTTKIPTGGQIWARFETEEAEVEVNYV